MWFFAALISAFLASFRKVNDKHLSQNVHHLHLSWMMKAAALPIAGLAALATGQLRPPESFPLTFWVCVFLTSFVLTPLDTAVYLQSLKHGQLSKTAPMMALWPVVMLLAGAIFLGQTPKPLAILAVLIVATGVYVLNTSRGNWNMFQNIWQDRGSRFGLVGVGTVSLNTTAGAVAVAHSAPLFYAFWASLLGTLVQFTYAQSAAPGLYRHPHIKLIAKNGSIQGAASVLYFSAVAAGPIGYVAAMRSLSSTFAALHGAQKFDEGMGKRKLMALCLIALGAILLGIDE